jgi:PAS domain S-box-containing protein
VRWRPLQGRMHAYVVSGEPRFDSRGVFTGYWGVSRDVSEMLAAREALAATETRYQELFSRIPTPLVLHRGGLVIDANPAALQLFGHGELPAMVGTDLMAHYESGDSRERARRRLDQLAGQAPGTALPVTGLRLDILGRVVSVRSTCVQVDAGGAPAVLDIFIDDTERLAAEDAVRRSEALLSHLVATSPDLITLTEMNSGRYAMVNRSFERVSGWSVAEAVGRTSVELGIWAHPEDRERIVGLLRTEGQVSDVSAYFVTKTGKTVAMVLSAARFVMDRGEYLVINARDVTERERQRLEREAILSNASIGIAVTRQGRIVLANPHFAQIYAWDGDALVGQPGRVMWSSDTDFDEGPAELVPRLERGEAVEFERQARRRDGSTFIAHVRGHAIDQRRPLDGGTVWIVEDVTGRRAAEQALARARDDAEAASRAKSAFLANTSHELRTPLNGMMGLARLAGDAGTDEGRRRQYLEQIVENAQALTGIISDILDLSKIEAGKLRVESTTFDLGALLQSLQGGYATLAAAHGLVLRCEAAAEAAGHVVGDPLRLRQIATNFLTNAIKFTPSGWVALRVSRPGGPGTPGLRLEVQDSGPGIGEALRGRLFQPFTQGDDSTTRRFGGTGLGLSICRELATLMGGQVGVDSQPGNGSTFWAELPLPSVTTPAGDGHEQGDTATGLAGRRVLVAEDNPVNMMIVVAMLEGWGVRVAQAVDGQAAVADVGRAAAAGLPFDAVLMDVQMPVMSGHEATRCLRAAGHTLPVIALTAAALVTERDTALAAGMDDFLTKPIDGERLSATLLRWCSAPHSLAVGGS